MSTEENAGYAVVKARLVQRASEVKRRAEALNAARKAAFGHTALELVSQERARTEHHAVPRDMVQVGGHVVFAFQVFLGLKAETDVTDVVGVHSITRAEDGDVQLAEQKLGEGGEGTPPAVFGNETFVRDFKDVFKYAKHARVVQLRRTESRLFLFVQVGESLGDQKVFRFALDPNGKLAYIDPRGHEEAARPRSHDIEWKVLGPDAHVAGKHPHVSVANRVYVETVNGDLTIKIENNTETGLGILAEPVLEPRQTLNDAEFAYAEAGRLVLLRIKPYREEPRFFVYDEVIEQAFRIDALQSACLLLPEEHGLVFPGGYYVEGQGPKSFVDSAGGADYRYDARISAPNGEDVLYVFHRDDDGSYCILPYNLIEKSVKNAVLCHGWCLLDDGTMLAFKQTGTEATKIHPIQVWKTPFSTVEHAARAAADGSYLSRVGNAELVRGLAEAISLARNAESERATFALYQDLAKACGRFADSYYWAQKPEAESLGLAVAALGETAGAMLEEFEKERAMQKRAHDALAEAEEAQSTLLAQVAAPGDGGLEAHLGALADLRVARGRVIGLRDLRAMDLARVDQLEKALVDAFAHESQACVDLLLSGKALGPLVKSLQELASKVESAQKTIELEPLDVDLERISNGIGLLSEALSGLAIDDAAQKTRVLEETSEVFAHANRARALLRTRRQTLGSSEAQAEYAVRIKLFGQMLSTAVAEASTVEATDERLAKVLLALEELEARFGGYDQYAAELVERRVEVTEAFAARRQTLSEERQKKAAQLAASAGRVLESIARRAATFQSLDELQGYFATDPMVQKVEELAKALTDAGDSVRAEEIRSRAKSTRQEALRARRDKEELSGEGNTVKLGQYPFAVTTQALDLVLVPRSGEGAGDGPQNLYTHLTGTDFYERVPSAALDPFRDLWERTLISESPTVYRGELLAFSLLESIPPKELAALGEAGLAERVRAFAAERYDEGYERGVHDHDGAKLLAAWLPLRRDAGPLTAPPECRAYAALFFATLPDADRQGWEKRAKAATRLARTLGSDHARARLEHELAVLLAELPEIPQLPHSSAALAARYLIQELSAETVQLHASRSGRELFDALTRHLEERGEARAFQLDLEAEGSASARLALALEWVRAFVGAQAGNQPPSASRDGIAVEAALRFALPNLPHAPLDVVTETTVSGLLGQHPRIQNGSMQLILGDVEVRLARFVQDEMPRFRAFRHARSELVGKERSRLRLEEYKPKVMSAFVRNALIDEVYLPLVGANLAKQIGTAGAKKRTDQMGLLLLVSPPGYGKTTLMEYVAERLGLIFMKVNGPALGHLVTSLDPAAAPDATSRQEVEKINLAFEMGQNVMLYLDDIQHVSSELLQKFISLCDAQRKVEGAWGGRTRTYDLKGKRFCVVMAGNPYTETGARFQIPDMLANRADTYNLGEILEGKDDLFLLSYLENALTSNEVTAPLAARSPKDVRRLVAIAGGDESKKSELEHPFGTSELNELTTLFRHLIVVRDLLAKVNRAYVRSASQDDAYRTAPPFKLQGSYRNMSKIAEKVVPAMNTDELQRLIGDHYRGESQTLTKGAEENLLALSEIRERLSSEERTRWDSIKSEYLRQKRLGKSADDPASRVVGGLSLLEAEIGKLREGVAEAAARPMAIQLTQAVLPEIADALKQRSDLFERVLIPLVERIGQDTGARDSDEDRESIQRVVSSLGQIEERLTGLGAQMRKVLTQSQAPPRSVTPPPLPAAPAPIPAHVPPAAPWPIPAGQRSAPTPAAVSWQQPVASQRPPAPASPAVTPTLTIALGPQTPAMLWSPNGDPLAGGIFVGTSAQPPAIGTRLALHVSFPNGERHQIQGEVVFVHMAANRPGYGIRTAQPSVHAAQALRAFAAVRAPLQQRP